MNRQKIFTFLPTHTLNDPSKDLSHQNIQSVGKKRSRAVIVCNECKKSKKKCIGWNQSVIPFIPCSGCCKKGIECILPPRCNLCQKKLDNTGFCSNINCKKKKGNSENTFNEKEKEKTQSSKDILVKDENFEKLEKEIQLLKNDILAKDKSLKDDILAKDEKLKKLEREIQSLKDCILVKDENFEMLKKEIQTLKDENSERLKEEIQLLRDDTLKIKKIEERIKLLENDNLMKGKFYF
ncbi:7576_t:CDS:1 [Dentiscutata heterogama]|uniref:7576_t:CDS:1 n=1 Tax=Dentiscutata heterogama TaxID=1316150 RepID=A0ACA9LMT6_9GLOM|nr:7576_t:CDS:1 [Dentiscutata heterogama]